MEDCVSGQSLIQELRSATREGDIVTTIVPTDEKPDDLKIVGTGLRIQRQPAMRNRLNLLACGINGALRQSISTTRAD